MKFGLRRGEVRLSCLGNKKIYFLSYETVAFAQLTPCLLIINFTEEQTNELC